MYFVLVINMSYLPYYTVERITTVSKKYCLTSWRGSVASEDHQMMLWQHLCQHGFGRRCCISPAPSASLCLTASVVSPSAPKEIHRAVYATQSMTQTASQTVCKATCFCCLMRHNMDREVQCLGIKTVQWWERSGGKFFFIGLKKHIQYQQMYSLIIFSCKQNIYHYQSSS